MARVAPLFLLLAALVAAASALETIHCATVRLADAGSLAGLAEARELDALDGSERPQILTRLPWKVLPSDARFVAGNGTLLADLSYLVARPDDAAWLSSLLARLERPLFLTPLALEWGPVERSGAVGCRRGSDALELRWSDTTYWRPFGELAVPCDLAVEQSYRIDALAPEAWGSEPRIERAGRAFRPTLLDSRNGESMTAIVERLARADPASRPEAAELTMRYRSGASYPLLSLSYVTCVSLDVGALLAAIGERASAAAASIASAADRPADAALLRAGFAREPDHADVAELAARGESLDAHGASADSELLWPTHGCVETDRSGSCTVSLGYASTIPGVVRVDAAEPDNYFSPADSTRHVRPPEEFSFGVHPEAVRVRWFCLGLLPGEWIDLQWTLLGATVTVGRQSPRCANDRDFAAPRPDFISQHRRSPPSIAPADDALTADRLMAEVLSGRRPSRRALLSLGAAAEPFAVREYCDGDHAVRLSTSAGALAGLVGAARVPSLRQLGLRVALEASGDDARAVALDSTNAPPEPSLGTPHASAGGPGVGRNGASSSERSGNLRPLGAVLAPRCGPERRRCSACLDAVFDRPSTVETVALLDVGVGSRLVLTSADGTALYNETTPPEASDNGVVTIALGVAGVARLSLCLSGGGALASLTYDDPGSGKVRDACGVCGGDGRSCAAPVRSARDERQAACRQRRCWSAANGRYLPCLPQQDAGLWFGPPDAAGACRELAAAPSVEAPRATDGDRRRHGPPPQQQHQPPPMASAQDYAWWCDDYGCYYYCTGSDCVYYGDDDDAAAWALFAVFLLFLLFVPIAAWAACYFDEPRVAVPVAVPPPMPMPLPPPPAAVVVPVPAPQPQVSLSVSTRRTVRSLEL